VRRGPSDYCLPIPVGGFHGLFIELKRDDGGRRSDEQITFIENARKRGYRAEFCEGYVEAFRVLCEYMGVRPLIDRLPDPPPAAVPGRL